MPVFEYKGKTLAGAVVEGSITAKDRPELERILRQNRIMVTSIEKKAAEFEFKLGTGVSRLEISRFTRQFATMIGAGLPMVQCLEILAQQGENKEFA
ncbi:MAG: type II secretion system F family protein, partial [candidate division Zixibacteria bacterium]|nr:type II secretion system F family protein [candidate division Zixibacteria bacterium]